MARSQKKCIICGGSPEKTKFGYRKPDKYEKWVGLENIKRLWVKCKDCGFYWQLRNYPLSKLDEIYKEGYRNPLFRGETIEQAFNRIEGYRLTSESENQERYVWFAKGIKYKQASRLLDVGSGIGVWPNILKVAEFDVTCVDTNVYSVDFIANELDMRCYYDLRDVPGIFDTVTLVHVLEHILDIDGFLEQVRLRLKNDGYLYVEVPSCSNFKLLEKDHDDFNSCHQWFFSEKTLSTVLKKNGFKPYRHDICGENGKHRIRMLCR
jgi:SAM-dependent methyltransferase